MISSPTYFYTKLKKTLKMKKVFAIFAIAALAACGGASTEVKTDSAATTVDSSSMKMDSTKTDSSAVKMDSTKK
jgi:uncharacterized lipoprotein YajG